MSIAHSHVIHDMPVMVFPFPPEIYVSYAERSRNNVIIILIHIKFTNGRLGTMAMACKQDIPGKSQFS